MIKKIRILISNEEKKCKFSNENNKVIIDLSSISINKNNSFTIEIEFNEKIKLFRNNDYKWVDVNKDRIAPLYCSKIIKLNSELFVQANSNNGIWEVKSTNPHTLFWHFNIKNSKPITNYFGKQNIKMIDATNDKSSFEAPSLLFTTKPIEFSRSKIPFSAIACFTDHCDFDTDENLKLQRELLNQSNIKVTKGFFLEHFSKRNDNASYKNNPQEFQSWINNGHELCYHSLSQSIKPIDASIEDFKKFIPPFENINVWIDHGYQPYNLSLYKNNKINEEEYKNTLSEKKIEILWNYIDSGTSTKGILNQLNSNHFTLNKFWKGIKNEPFVARTQMMIKNILFHFYADEKLIAKYKSLAANFKYVFYNKKITKLFPLILNATQVAIKIFKLFLFWNRNKHKPYKLAKYSPILFKHFIEDKEFMIFQTIELIDFKSSLCKENIDELIQENGIFIAHTYFSAPMKYHKGKLFKKENSIDSHVADNFNYLGSMIGGKKIWNPTLSELVLYWKRIDELVLDIDNNGMVYIKKNNNLIFRQIN